MLLIMGGDGTGKNWSRGPIHGLGAAEGSALCEDQLVQLANQLDRERTVGHERGALGGLPEPIEKSGRFE